MTVRDPVAFDVHPAHGGGVEQDVDEVVVQQVDLVDVENTAVCTGQQARREGVLTVAQHLLQVEGADHPVLGRPDRQLHQVTATGGLKRHGQHLRQPADRGRLRGALLAADQYSADVGPHCAQHQRQPKAVVPDQRTERVADVDTVGDGHGFTIDTCGMPSSRNSSPARTNPCLPYISTR